ncbi:AAA family ATPase [Geodermatophilus dictyosporus]|nr:AAA family ATPase [Geodermatophilus dictyosporus]
MTTSRNRLQTDITTAVAASTGAGLRFRDVFDPADWPELEREPHLIAGLLSTTLTVLSGAPTAGKTHLAVGMAAALLNGEREFLGRELSGELNAVAFVCTDADGAASVRRRIAPLVAAPSRKRVRVVDYSATGDAEWTALVHAVTGLAPGLLVVDNVLGVVDDVHDNGQARRMIGPLLRLTQQGTAVLLLTHTGEPGPTGPAHGVNAPIGARTWTVAARVKAVLTSREKDHRRQLAVRSNDGEPVALNASLDVMGDAPVWTLWTGDGEREQRRESRTAPAVTWDALADRVVREQPRARSLSALGDHYAASVNRSPVTVRTSLKGRVRLSGDRWERTP